LRTSAKAGRQHDCALDTLILSGAGKRAIDYKDLERAFLQ